MHSHRLCDQMLTALDQQRTLWVNFFAHLCWNWGILLDCWVQSDRSISWYLITMNWSHNVVFWWSMIIEWNCCNGHWFFYFSILLLLIIWPTLNHQKDVVSPSVAVFPAFNLNGHWDILGFERSFGKNFSMTISTNNQVPCIHETFLANQELACFDFFVILIYIALEIIGYIVILDVMQVNLVTLTWKQISTAKLTEKLKLQLQKRDHKFLLSGPCPALLHTKLWTISRTGNLRLF